jgi:hypothetical protein
LKSGKPVGPTEEDAVLSIAKGVWRKRRAQKLLHAQIERRRFDPKELLYDKEQTTRRFLSIIETAPYVTLVDAAPGVFKHLYGNLVATYLHVDQAEYLKQICPRKNFPSGSEWLQAVRNEISSSMLPALEASGEAPPDALLSRAAEFFTPEVAKQELAVDERIDAMLDRAVKRLVQTKAVKQMLTGASDGKDDQQQIKPIRSSKPNGSAKGANHKRPSGV